MSTQRPSIHQTQSWVNTALSFICLLCSWVCTSHCFAQFSHSSTDGKCNKTVLWMVIDSKECMRETHFVLCLRPRKEIISGSLEWIYIVFQDAIYGNLKSLETKEVQNLARLLLLIWRTLLSKATYNRRLWAVLKGPAWQCQDFNSQPCN